MIWRAARASALSTAGGWTKPTRPPSCQRRSSRSPTGWTATCPSSTARSSPPGCWSGTSPLRRSASRMPSSSNSRPTMPISTPWTPASHRCAGWSTASRCLAPSAPAMLIRAAARFWMPTSASRACRHAICAACGRGSWARPARRRWPPSGPSCCRSAARRQPMRCMRVDWAAPMRGYAAMPTAPVSKWLMRWMCWPRAARSTPTAPKPSSLCWPT